MATVCNADTEFSLLAAVFNIDMQLNILSEVI